MTLPRREMKPWIRPDHVRQHLPAGRELPARFDAFVQADPPFRVEWNDLDAYSLKPSATEEAIPFLRMPDGALVALWYCDASPAVVHIGGHGEMEVIACSFDDFLKACAARCSGVPDIDEGDTVIRVPGVGGEPNREGLHGLQKRFEEWFKRHTSLLPPHRTPEAEELRQRVYGIAEAMIRDGLVRVFAADGKSYWTLHYRVERGSPGLSISYLDFGKRKPVPEKYKLTDEVLALMELVKDKDRSLYEFVVNCKGLVSVDRDRQLLLLPSENAPT